MSSSPAPGGCAARARRGRARAALRSRAPSPGDDQRAQPEPGGLERAVERATARTSRTVGRDHVDRHVADGDVVEGSRRCWRFASSRASRAGRFASSISSPADPRPQDRILANMRCSPWVTTKSNASEACFCTDRSDDQLRLPQLLAATAHHHLLGGAGGRVAAVPCARLGRVAAGGLSLSSGRSKARESRSSLRIRSLVERGGNERRRHRDLRYEEALQARAEEAEAARQRRTRAARVPGDAEDLLHRGLGAVQGGTVLVPVAVLPGARGDREHGEHTEPEKLLRA